MRGRCLARIVWVADNMHVKDVTLDDAGDRFVITFTGTFRRTTELTKPQRDLLAALRLDPPKKIVELASSL